MTDRRVTQSRKDKDGDIVALCNPSESWSPRLKADVIRDIDGKDLRYYVQAASGRQVDVHVVEGKKGKYLRTDPDASTRNNLDDLPGC